MLCKSWRQKLFFLIALRSMSTRSLIFCISSSAHVTSVYMLRV
uniref:Uncharacterized protein n=1 Tax=Arundo donax TaxID=35708 RepID=A0A0A9DYY8_ARUDO